MKSSFETFTMPMWTCPACQKEQQCDEYYELESGCTLCCQFCEKEFHVAYTDTTFEVTISIHPEDVKVREERP